MQSKPRLLGWLQQEHPAYAAGAQTLRDRVKPILSLVSRMFAHYTQHTIEHSDEVVAEASLLLFDPESDEPVVRLSGAEGFLIAAAGYLHDVGMVVPDNEVADIKASADWEE